MPKMNWDKINREKSGASHGGPVVSYVSNKPDSRPTCIFYSISRKNNRRTCGSRVSATLGHDEDFCQSHQGYVLLSKERGWFPSPEMSANKSKARKEQKKYQKHEAMLAHEMERRYRRNRG